MDAAHQRLDARCPGIRVSSEVQAYALLDEFEVGLDHYESLAQPTPEDTRWAGVCYFSLFRDADAIAAYRQAIDGGCQAARINLAHSLAFVDRADEIVGQLEQVNFERLSVYDRVLYLRVKSLNDERNGQLHVALQQAEHAWRLVQGSPEFTLLAPKLLNQLGILHGRIGRAQRALWYLDRNLEISVGDEKTRVHVTRVRVLNSLGMIREARQEFELLTSAPEQYAAIVQLRNAEMSWAEGNVDRAMREYADAVRLAQKLQQTFEEFQASLDLALLLARFRDKNYASLLAKAQRLIADRSDRLLFRFREILIFMWEGRYSAPHTAAELATVAASFGEMGLLQEQGWVNAHIAHALHVTGDAEGSCSTLDSLTALAVTLQNPAFLIREWQLMPDFSIDVGRTHPTLALMNEASRKVQGKSTA